MVMFGREAVDAWSRICYNLLDSNAPDLKLNLER